MSIYSGSSVNSPTSTMQSNTLIANSGLSNDMEETKTLITSINQTDSFTNKSNISSLLSTFNQSNLSRLEETESQDQDNGDDSEGAPPREVGHNLYILAHKLAKFNKELSVMLRSRDCMENEALAYYAAHTAQIEVCFLF